MAAHRRRRRRPAWPPSVHPRPRTTRPGERGLYRRTKATGHRTLLLDGTQADRPAAGAVDLVVDAANEDHLYVALWDRTRRAWDFTEGDPGGVFESIDGGATWSG